MVSSLSSSFFNSFRLQMCFHICFHILVFRFFLSCVFFLFSTNGVYLLYNFHNTKSNSDTLSKARPSPRVEKVTFSTKLREDQVVTSRGTMPVTFSTLRLQPTNQGTLWIVGIGGRSRPPCTYHVASPRCFLGNLLFVDICHYRVRDFLGGCDLDVIHVDYQNYYNLFIHYQSKHVRVYQALQGACLLYTSPSPRD